MTTVLTADPVNSGNAWRRDGRPFTRSEVSSSAFRAMRERFLSASSHDAHELTVAGVDQSLVDSWRRCLRYGLDAQLRNPLPSIDVDDDSVLARAANSVVSQREAMLEQSMCGLSLTDQHGVVVRQWVRDSFLNKWFDSQGIVPSASVDETTVGTTSGICLLNERPTMICGPEHFFEEYSHVTSAGVPIVHPVTRRIVGSLNLTSRFTDTSPVLLSWVMDIVRDIQHALQSTSTQRERSLLDAYLLENRDTRHPLVALNDQTIITNATAARLITAVDQALIWEHASRAIREGVSEPRQVILSNGTTVTMQCREIVDAAKSAGAVVRLRSAPTRKGRRRQASAVYTLPGLVGEGPRWRALCQAALMAGNSPVLVAGERGSGKFAVAKAIAGSTATVLDASECAALSAPEWLSRVIEALGSTESPTVIIRNCDELDDSTARSLASTLSDRNDSMPRVLATTSDPVDHGHPNPIYDAFNVVLSVPPLRERLEDLPCLLDALTTAACQRLGRAGRVRWMPEAVQALSRVQWTFNVGSLDTVVNRVLRSTSNEYIGASDLPADIVASASRRTLVGLQHLEANAITAALRAAGGNKNQAADKLGIARSTLYRKIRALGIDLSTAAF